MAVIVADLEGSRVLIGEALQGVVGGVLAQVVGGVGDGEADLAVTGGFDDAVADEPAAVLSGVLGGHAHALGDLPSVGEAVVLGHRQQVRAVNARQRP